MRADLAAELAQTLGVTPQALGIPNINRCIGLMHTLFDNYQHWAKIPSKELNNALAEQSKNKLPDSPSQIGRCNKT